MRDKQVSLEHSSRSLFPAIFCWDLWETSTLQRTANLSPADRARLTALPSFCAFPSWSIAWMPREDRVPCLEPAGLSSHPVHEIFHRFRSLGLCLGLAHSMAVGGCPLGYEMLLLLCSLGPGSLWCSMSGSGRTLHPLPLPIAVPLSLGQVSLLPLCFSHPKPFSSLFSLLPMTPHPCTPQTFSSFPSLSVFSLLFSSPCSSLHAFSFPALSPSRLAPLCSPCSNCLLKPVPVTMPLLRAPQP